MESTRDEHLSQRIQTTFPSSSRDACKSSTVNANLGTEQRQVPFDLALSTCGICCCTLKEQPMKVRRDSAAKPPMIRKLFTVKVQTEMLVLAKDERHAERTAQHVAQDEWPVRDLTKVHFSCEARPVRQLPAGYDLDEYPEENTAQEPELLNEPEHTVREWIESGAAPHYIPGRRSSH